MYLLFTLFCANNAFAGQVTVAWDANTEHHLAGYKIYYKTGSPGPPYDGVGATEGDSPIIIVLDPNEDGDTGDGDLSNPASPEFTIHGLSDTETTYSVVTAYSNDDSESGYSNELSIAPLPPANEPPTASLTADPVSGAAPLAVSFDGAGSSDPDGTIVSYSWAFGDSTTGSGETATHTYDAEGTYTVTLTVTDDYGDTDTATATIAVTVILNQPPDPPVLLSPLDGDSGVSLTPKLQCGTLTDPDGDTHAFSRWQISDTSDFAYLVLDIASDSHLTSLTVPDSVLDVETSYYWRVGFSDDRQGDSEWSGSYYFTTEAVANDADSNGIPDDQQVDPTVDVDRDGTFDVDQMALDSAFKCIDGGGLQIAVKGIRNVNSIESLKYIDPGTITDTSNRPDELPYGVITMRLTTVTPGDVAEVSVYFSEDLPAEFKWYKYDSVNGWEDYSQYTIANGDGRSITLQLRDGGHGDSDGVANGVIVDPGAIGISSISGDDPPLGSDSGGGGCFVASMM